MVTFVQCVLNSHLSQSFILFQSNVLCSEGHCYLTDFGISKMPAISTLGTFAQMVHAGWAAPELDQEPRSKHSDIFSFACTIYEVLVYYFLDLSLLFTYLCA
jgi:serine/threonine protein kinase